MNVYCSLLLLPVTLAFSLSSAWNAVVNGVTNISDGLTSVYSSIGIPEDAHLNISQLVTKHAYPFEEHKVFTEDGYILNTHRIPFGKNGTKNGMVVFLMHGLLDSSDSWVLQGPDSALGYLLADEGFDVWMGNARGNKHASTHKTLNSSVATFWEFTWEEIGLYDLPAMIDYVLNVTEKESLYYVGHSQGTTSFYVMSSMKSEYNEKIKMMFALAPEAWMGHVQSPIVRLFSPNSGVLGYVLSNFNAYSPSTEFFNKISAVFCGVWPIRCGNFWYAIMGFNNKINETLLPVIFGHMPSGSSVLQFVHYGQLVQSERFCRYDFGEEQNLEKYGVATPPEYNCSNIRARVMLFYSPNDWFSDKRDVETLKSCLPNVYDAVFVDFSHIDYVYSAEAKSVIYLKIIKQIQDFEIENSLLDMINVKMWR